MSVLAVAAAAAMALPAAAPAPAHTAATTSQIRISGSNTALPLVADLAFFYRRSVRHPPRFNIVGGGTQAGIVDAARGISDIGMSSRGRDPSDPAGTVFSRFARSAVCLVTSKDNPVPGFSRDQVQSLVSGQTTNWSQIAGSARTDDTIAAGLGPGTGERNAFLRLFVDLDTPVAYTQRTLANARQVRQYIEGTPNAWGYVDFAFSSGLHVLPFDGVPCTKTEILAGRYPGIFDVNYVTHGAPKGAVKRFVDWTRTSRLAHRIISTRYVAVR